LHAGDRKLKKQNAKEEFETRQSHIKKNKNLKSIEKEFLGAQSEF